MWLLGAVSIAALVVAVACFRYRFQLLQARSDLVRARVAELALAAGPLGVFRIERGGALRKLGAPAGLPGGEAASLAELAAAFDQADRAALDQAFESLQRDGVAFDLTVKGGDGTGDFAVAGRAGEAGPLVWVRNVSDQAGALRAAEAERDAQARLLDALPLPVWSRGGDLSLVYCNLAYARAVDRDRHAVLAEGIELPGTALASTSRALAGRAAEAGASQSESHHVVMGGARRLLELMETPLNGAGGTAGCAIDTTNAEELDTQLRRHTAAHADVLETLGSGIAIFGPDMRLKFFNNAYLQLWRIDEESLKGEPHFTDVMETLRERRRLPEQSDFRAYKAEALKTYSTLIEPAEELLHLPDGETFRMTATPHPFGGVLFTYEDVTDRLALEGSYNTLIAVQRETLDNLYEGVAVYGVDGRLKLFNPAFARIWRLPPRLLEAEPHARDVIGRTRDFFDLPESKWPDMLERMVTQIAEPDVHDGRFERADGSVVDWAQVPLPDGASLFTFLDVTDSIRVERALRERNEALETTDRLKSEFLANISYELRTPLNAIVGFAEILENKFFGELNERQLEYSRAIVESSQRLLALINDILDLATIEAGYLRLDLAPVDLKALIESIHTLGHERARSRGIELVLDCTGDVGTLHADERRLKQALFNLLSNALKFTPEGGQVTIGVRRDGEEVLLSVSDTGVGIPPDQQAQVFDKFERGAGQGRQTGAGLGLSLVKSLIELHHGSVELDSETDSGTQVVCRLPVNPPDESIGDLPPGGDEAVADRVVQA